MNKRTFYSILTILISCFFLSSGLLAAGTEIVYDNVSGKSRGTHVPNTPQSEMGDEIFLGGQARTITKIELDYYADVYQNVTPDKYVLFRIYRQDGDNVVTETGTILESKYPKTVLFESKPIQIFPNFNAFVIDGINVDIPEENVTWTLQSYGLEDGEYVGLTVIEVPTVGFSYSDFWERDNNEEQFDLKTFKNNDIAVNFSIRIHAQGAPSRTYKRLPQKGNYIPVQVTAPIYTPVSISYAEVPLQWQSTETVITTNSVTTLMVPATAQFLRPTTPQVILPEIAITDHQKWRYDLQFTGLPGSCYSLLFSKDMKSWKAAHSGVLHSGTVTVSDSSSFQSKQQGFYAVKLIDDLEPLYQFDEPDEVLDDVLIAYFSGAPGKEIKISHSADGVTWSEPTTRTFTFETLYDSSFGALSYTCPADTLYFNLEY